MFTQLAAKFFGAQAQGCSALEKYSSPRISFNSSAEGSSAIVIDKANLSFAKQPIFQEFSLAIPAQETTCFLGPSGIGKSSLLRLIIASQKNSNTAKPSLAYMAQDDLLLPWLTVLDNVLIGFYLRQGTLFKRKKVTETQLSTAKDLLNKVGLKEVWDFKPSALSGGMRQRVALARTLMEDCSIVLMDEPFARLDWVTRTQLQDLAQQLLRQRTVVLVTHDPMEALKLGNQIHILGGRPVKIAYSLALTDNNNQQLGDLEMVNLLSKLKAELEKAAHAW